MVVPHRPAIQAAKALATLDVLSNGRLILGVGAGWMEEEFKLLGANFAERGAVTDEYIEAFRQLWSADRPAYKGRHVDFEDVIFAPRPMQPSGPPIWVGGESQAAMRRAVRLGNGWYPGNNNQRMLMDTPERLKAGIASLDAMAEAARRDPATINKGLIIQGPFDWTRQQTQDKSARRMFTGTSEDMRADSAALAEAGVRHVALRCGGDTVTEAIERIERFGAEVIAAARTDGILP